MRGIVAALLLIAGLAGAGTQCFQSYPMHKGNMDSTTPPFIERHKTFQANLQNSLQATVANGSPTATYSGGGLTGAGSKRGCVDCAGIITWQTSGPCFSCGGSTLAYESMGARTNLLSDNGGMTQGWTQGRLRTTESTDPAILAVDNSSATYYVMAENADAANWHRRYQTFTGTTDKNQCVSVYAKAGGRTWLALRVADNANGGGIFRSYNLATGALGTGVVSAGASASNWWESSASISAAGNGWYRCVLVTGTTTGTGYFFGMYMASADNTVAYNGDNSSSLFVCFPQAESNATFASAPIFTAGATGARAADILTYSIAGNVSQERGTFRTYGYYTPAVAHSVIFGGGATTGFLLYTHASTLNGIQVYDGTNVVAVTSAGITTPQRLASSWGGSAMNIYYNDQNIKSGTFDGNMSVNTSLSIGSSGNIQSKVALFSVDLTSWELSLLR